MKAKITQREARSLGAVAIGYCEASCLLQYENPIYYTSGIYGRKSDIYNINGRYISTGYGPDGEHANYDLVKDYNMKAHFVLSDYSLDYEERKQKVKALLNEFLELV